MSVRHELAGVSSPPSAMSGSAARATLVSRPRRQIIQWRAGGCYAAIRKRRVLSGVSHAAAHDPAFHFDHPDRMRSILRPT
jgi:hypothetical protein